MLDLTEGDEYDSENRIDRVYLTLTSEAMRQFERILGYCGVAWEDKHR